jgi:hypothetical protein
VTGRDAAKAFAAWAAFLIALGIPLYFWHSETVPLLLAPAAVLGTLVLAAGGLFARDPGRRVLANGSFAPFLAALGLMFIAIGGGVGLWAILVGAWIVVVSLVVLLREERG